MKKNFLYGGLLLLFIVAAGFIVLKYKTDTEKKSDYILLERKGLLAKAPEWPNIKLQAEKIKKALDKNPADIKSLIAMTNLFLMEARVTGNYQYYDQAAMSYVERVLAKEQNNFDALSLKSMIFLSQHHFAEGLAMATTAEKINPYNAFVYGILVDGHVEMGNYDSAVMSAEKMMAIRPDLRSYARAAYLREIHGDYPGAIEAMKMAIDAGETGVEGTEWSRVQLGQLYENTGDLKLANECYELSLNYRPGYAPALAGMARMAISSKNYPNAIVYYQQADSLSNDFTFKEEMIEVYQLAGQQEKAATMAKLVIDDMSRNAVASANDNTIGHYADKELAYAYLKMNNTDKALEHALAEYNRRPKNIEVNETVAWVYYQQGQFEKALPHIQTALKTNSKNPTLLSRAGLIFQKNGDSVNAKKYLEEALKNNANLPAVLKLDSEKILNEIKMQTNV